VKIIRGLHNIRAEHQQCVATIGNFDGLHLGHQDIIVRLKQVAAERGVPATLITFEPYPQEFLRPDPAISRLTRFREKMTLLKEWGVDQVLCLRFNQWLASLEPEQFIQLVLAEKLAIRHLIVGDDFRFGRQRRGDFDMLTRSSEEYGYSIENTETVAIDDERVSSTRVRKTLADGDMQTVKRLLGRDYAMLGRVAHGDKRGRTIGFPTANIHLHRKSVPVSGVYAVNMEGLGNTPVTGVANVGNRPTVDGTRSLLEVHLFDFDHDIYGRHVKVNFIDFIRPEMRFDGLDALKQQIARDSEQARKIHLDRSTNTPTQ